MSKPFDNVLNMAYPTGCKEITQDLETNEIMKRLRMLARSFEKMSQEEGNDYRQLAMYLVTKFFIEHADSEVRLLVACCVSDIFRIYAPEAPYSESDQLQEIFLFLIRELKGLGDPDGPSFKRYLYLLENLDWVKTFNICLEMNNTALICKQLFTTLFSVASDDSLVVAYMLDIMASLISEADNVTVPELIDVVLDQIVEPQNQNRPASSLARELIKKILKHPEPALQQNSTCG